MGLPAKPTEVREFSNQSLPYGMNNNLVTPIEIPVKIYFFITTDVANPQYKYSIKESWFPIKVKDNPYSDIEPDVGDKYSMAQICKFYEKFIATINAVKFGIRLIYFGYAITDKWLFNDNNISTIQISKLGAFAVHRDTRKSTIPYFSLNLGQTEDSFDVNGTEDVFLHEFRHCLGYGHNNEQIGNVGIKRRTEGSGDGYYSYIPYWGAPAANTYDYFSSLYYSLRRGLDEDNTSIIWSFYGKESSQTFPIVTISGTITDNETNRKYFLDGQSTAYIFDRKTKELMVQSIIIAKTGAFKFVYPIGFNKSLKLGLLIASCEFHSAFVSEKVSGTNTQEIYKPTERTLQKQDDGYYKSTYAANDNILNKDWPGRIYYYSIDIKTTDQTLTVDPSSNLKISKNIRQMEKNINCHILYAEGSFVIGSDKFEYECISDHISDPKTKPVTGKEYNKKWQQVSDIVGDYHKDTKEWKNSKNYNSKFSNKVKTRLDQQKSLVGDTTRV